MAVNTIQPTLFGIPNCDTVKKAQRWLAQQDIGYDFHDIRAHPLTIEQWRELVTKVGVEAIVNKRSTSWRGLSEAEQRLESVDAVATLLQQHPTLMKRPLLTPIRAEISDSFLIGFKESEWSAELHRI